jgi:hypothetical protein
MHHKQIILIIFFNKMIYFQQSLIDVYKELIFQNYHFYIVIHLNILGLFQGKQKL